MPENYLIKLTASGAVLVSALAGEGEIADLAPQKANESLTLASRVSATTVPEVSAQTRERLTALRAVAAARARAAYIAQPDPIGHLESLALSDIPGADSDLWNRLVEDPDA